MINMYDVNGYVVDVASIHDYAETMHFIDKFTNVDYLRGMINTGQTKEMQEVILDIDKISSNASTESVSVTLSNILEGLKKAKEIAIISS